MLQNDTEFPYFRSFDWFCGHSWARGLLFAYDGKDQVQLLSLHGLSFDWSLVESFFYVLRFAVAKVIVIFIKVYHTESFFRLLSSFSFHSFWVLQTIPMCSLVSFHASLRMLLICY